MIKSFFTNNYRAKKILSNLLRTFVFTKNPLYRYLYFRNIKNKIKVLKDKPSAVLIENTNYCNISCVFCAQKQMKRKRGFIDEGLFKSIIGQCAFHKIHNVVIQGFGEPLLDKDYPAKIAYAKDRGIENVYCVTNGVLLTEETAKKLLESNLDYICISIDAASKEIYGQIHRIPGTDFASDSFLQVVKNIDNLISLKKEKKSAKPSIEVRFKDFDMNKKDLHRFIKKYKGLVDKINIYMNITNWPGSTIKNNLPDGMPLLKFPCYNLWSSLFITYDGNASICCQDYECRNKIGDVNKDNLMDIWNSRKLEDIRKAHLEGRFNQLDVCSECIINTHYLTPWWQNG